MADADRGLSNSIAFRWPSCWGTVRTSRKGNASAEREEGVER